MAAKAPDMHFWRIAHNVTAVARAASGRSLTDDAIGSAKKDAARTGAASMLWPGRRTGSDWGQSTLSSPFVNHVVADGSFFPHTVPKVLQLGVVTGFALIA